MADCGLDGGAASQFAFDLAVNTGFLAGNEVPERFRRAETTVALVDVDSIFRPVSSCVSTITLPSE